MIALTFALPKTIQGMEDFSTLACKAYKVIDIMVLNGFDITEDHQQKKREHEKIRKNPFERCPEEIRFNILERVVIDNGNANNLRDVCQDWHRIIEQDEMKESIESAIYQRFLKGVLIYRPQAGSDVGRIDLPIAALKNPLEGTFDLSLCGNADQYLSISTGYRRWKKEENKNKLEIWFVPKFFIGKELNTTAQHFQNIYGNWNDNAPIGIFWTWGGWDNLRWFDYLTTVRLDSLSNNSLYEKWVDARAQRSTMCQPMRAWGELKRISCLFYEQK